MERPVGVSVTMALVSYPNFHAPLFQVVEYGDEVAQAAAKPVEFPDNQRVAGFEFLKTAEKGRALGGCTRQAVILEGGFAAGLL
jgi:hypothetical protein